MIDPIMFHTVIGVSPGGYIDPAGLYVWDFTNESAEGYLHQKTDLYGGGWNVESTANVDDYPVTTNDAETMVQVYQSGAAAQYQGWGYSAPKQGLSKLKFRIQVDLPTNDNGHRVEVNVRDTITTGSTDYLNFLVMGTGILQCWRWNGSSNQVLINVSGLNGTGPRTVMGYITGTNVYMKGKNGYDDAYSWTTWNTDVNGNGAFTFDMSDKYWFLSNGNDTAPLTHGYVRKLEIMTPDYSGWAD